MQCMKCGRDVQEGQVFCGDCAAVMERYPVKPGTRVSIPTRPKKIIRETTKVKPEEIIAGLETKLRRIKICAMALFLALVACAGALVYTIVNHDEGFSIGQNYHTATEPNSPGGR